VMDTDGCSASQTARSVVIAVTASTSPFGSYTSTDPDIRSLIPVRIPPPVRIQRPATDEFGHRPGSTVA